MVVGLQMSRSPNSTTGLNFKIFVEVVSTSGVEQEFTARISLPAGLRWGSDGPDPSEGCTGAEPAVCKQQMLRNQVGTVGGGWAWDVIAERAGFYEITAAVEPVEPDPDISNNTSLFRFEVKQEASGGGGSTGPDAVASAVKLVPAKPRAGAAVAATVRVTTDGAPVTPTRIACAGAIGSVKAKGTGKAARGTATCIYRTPSSAKGKVLRATVSFTAGTTRFTKRFSVRLR